MAAQSEKEKGINGKFIEDGMRKLIYRKNDIKCNVLNIPITREKFQTGWQSKAQIHTFYKKMHFKYEDKVEVKGWKKYIMKPVCKTMKN